MDTLKKYIKVLETGQGRLYVLLIKNQKKFIQEIVLADI